MTKQPAVRICAGCGTTFAVSAVEWVLESTIKNIKPRFYCDKCHMYRAGKRKL